MHVDTVTTTPFYSYSASYSYVNLWHGECA